MKLNVFEGARRIALLSGGLWVVGCLAYAVFSEPYASMTYAVAWPGEQPLMAESCADEDATKYVSAKITGGKSIGVTICFTAHKASDGRLLVPFASMPIGVDDLGSWIVANKNKIGTPKFERVAKAYEQGRADSSAKPWDIYSALRDADAKGDAVRAKQLAAAIQALSPGRFTMNTRYSSDVSEYAEAVSRRFEIPPSAMAEAEKSLWRARLDQWKQAGQVMAGGLVFGWLLTLATGWIVRGFMGIPRGKDARSVE